AISSVHSRQQVSESVPGLALPTQTSQFTRISKLERKLHSSSAWSSSTSLIRFSLRVSLKIFQGYITTSSTVVLHAQVRRQPIRIHMLSSIRFVQRALETEWCGTSIRKQTALQTVRRTLVKLQPIKGRAKSSTR